MRAETVGTASSEAEATEVKPPTCEQRAGRFSRLTPNPSPMEYEALVAIYEDIAATAADTEKTALLADALETTDAELLGPVVLLLQGKLFPSHSDAELGISSSLASDAIAKATGVSEDEIEDQWAETGDLGDVAAWAVDNRQQQTLFAQDLDVQSVFETLREAATYEGNGSQQRRIDLATGETLSIDASDPSGDNPCSEPRPRRPPLRWRSGADREFGTDGHPRGGSARRCPRSDRPPSDRVAQCGAHSRIAGTLR